MGQSAARKTYGQSDIVAFVRHEEPGAFEAGNRPAECSRDIVVVEVRRRELASELRRQEIGFCLFVLNLPGSQC